MVCNWHVIYLRIVSSNLNRLEIIAIVNQELKRAQYISEFKCTFGFVYNYQNAAFEKVNYHGHLSS